MNWYEHELIKEINKKKGEFLLLDMNAYIEGEHTMLIDIFLCMHEFRESMLDSFDKCFIIIKKWEIVEPLFDFDDTKTLLLWFQIKLLSISDMNLTPKVKASLSLMKIQHPIEGFDSHMDRFEFRFQKVWSDKWIRI